MAHIIITGIAGFIIFHLVDIAAIKRVPLLKPLTWVLGCGLVAYAVAAATLTGDKLALPLWLVITGWAVLALSLAQLVYSLFINLPFRKTYVERGVGEELITTGLYAVVRHPGVYGLGTLMLAAAVVSGSRLLFAATPVWMAVDVIVVVIQDRVFFDRMYPGYPAYRKTTPMLIPTWHSLAAFAAGFTLTNIKSRRTP